MPMTSVPTPSYPYVGTSTQARYTHGPQYNSSGEYDVFQTPTPARRTGGAANSYDFQPQPIIYEGQVHPPPQGYPESSSGPLSASRTYDSTIPQYYPVMGDKAWAQGPTPDVSVSKRKGKGKATPAAARTDGMHMGMGTPTPAAKQRGGKRTQVTPEEAERSAKRARKGDLQLHPAPMMTMSASSASVPPAASHSVGAAAVLPTPPPADAGTYSGQSMAYAELGMDSPDSDNMGERNRQSGVRVMHSIDEGRKLAVGHGEEGELSPVEDKPARLTPVPSLALDEDGQARIGTEQILQSDLAWMENGGARAGPVLARDTVAMPESPGETEERIEKRLSAFASSSRTEEMAQMVCTRIDSMGRVAVRKDVAARFLGLGNGTRLVEELRQEDEDEWVNSMASSSSAFRSTIKPSWPDDQAPWSIGGGLRRDRRSREDREKAALLRRYLETSPDEASDEEVLEPKQHPRGKGKSVARLVSYSLPQADPRQRQALDNSSADAKAALLTVIRHRQLPPVVPAVIACACGGGPVPGRQTFIMCCQCKSWHHCVCTGQEPGTMDWWCPPCQHDLIRPSTPPRQALRTYHESQERSSAFKGQVDHIALAPSPMFAPHAPAFTATGTALRTPVGRVVASPSSRNHRSRILSYGGDMWPYNDTDGDAENDAGPAGRMPTTPAPDARFTTPRIDDAPFDVTSTPSRHIDFNFGGAPLFSLTPLGGRSRQVSGFMIDTPLGMRGQPQGGRVTSGVNPDGLGLGSGMGGRHDFLRDLAGPSGPAAASTSSTSTSAAAAAAAGLAELASPRSATRPHFSLGQGLSPSLSPRFGQSHKRTMSGNKFSALRTGGRSGLGLGMPAALGVGSAVEEEEEEEEDVEEGAGDEDEDEGKGGRGAKDMLLGGSLAPSSRQRPEAEKGGEGPETPRVKARPRPSKVGDDAVRL